MADNLTSPGAVAPDATRNLWLIGGALAIASAAGAATIALRAGPTPTPAPVAAALDKNESVVAVPKTLAVPVPVPTPTPLQAPAAKPQAKAAPARPAQRVAAAPACVNCGVVESVQAVKRKGDASGVGAVAGGVIGAVAGNQVGKGDGRKAMTVIGAVGGGLAGHEIEKRKNSTTVQQVKVRMDDGSLRTIEQAQAPKVGARVQVEGSTLKAAPAARG